MRKIAIHRAGGHDRLELEEHPDPEPGPGEVAVDVAAAGINYADLAVRMGLYESAKRYVGWPITPGFEVAGPVAAVGADVDDLRVGEDVIAITRFGGYASRIVVPRHQVFARPDGWSAEEAAGFPAVFLTAWYALFELAHPRPARTALVHSAAGGVGGALVQLLKDHGCRVIGVVGAGHKVEPVRALGADAVIDKSAEALWPAVARHAKDGCDLILDANGASTLGDGYRNLAAGGRLVTYGFASMLPRGRARPSWIKLAREWLRTPAFHPLDMVTNNKSVLAFNLSFLFHETTILAEGMADLLARAERGAIRPAKVTTYPLAEVARAHADLESGETVGKLVLIP